MSTGTKKLEERQRKAKLAKAEKVADPSPEPVVEERRPSPPLPTRPTTHPVLTPHMETPSEGSEENPAEIEVADAGPDTVVDNEEPAQDDDTAIVEPGDAQPADEAPAEEEAPVEEEEEEPTHDEKGRKFARAVRSSRPTAPKRTARKGKGKK